MLQPGGNNKGGNFVNKAARDSEDIMFLYLSLFVAGHSCSKSL